jgi:hypothetical protein
MWFLVETRHVEKEDRNRMGRMGRMEKEEASPVALIHPFRRGAGYFR